MTSQRGKWGPVGRGNFEKKVPFLLIKRNETRKGKYGRPPTGRWKIRLASLKGEKYKWEKKQWSQEMEESERPLEIDACSGILQASRRDAVVAAKPTRV